MKTVRTAAFTSLLIAATAAQAANTYPGNGATGFGGAVGTGSLAISDTASSLTITLNRGAGQFNDDLVLYLDTKAGGYTDTSLFGDNGDGGREAISGANNGNPSRSVATFVPGFGADYAISMQNGFIGVFDLSNPNNFTFLSGQGQSGLNTDPSYSITLNAAQMAQIGLTPNSGQTFFIEGSYISTSAYRANETIGSSFTSVGDPSANPGFNNPQQFTSDSAYTLMTVPEPSSISLIGLGVASLMALRRRK